MFEKLRIFGRQPEYATAIQPELPADAIQDMEQASRPRDILSAFGLAGVTPVEFSTGAAATPHLTAVEPGASAMGRLADQVALTEGMD